MRLYFIVVTSFSKYRTSFLGGRRLPKLSKYMTRLFLCVREDVTGLVLSVITSSRFTISLSFRRASLVGNMLCMKMPLKCGTRICFASSFNCTVVAPDSFFIIFLAFFFFFATTPCPCLYGPRYSPRLYLYVGRYSPRPFHRTIVTLLFEHVARLCCRLSFSPRWPLIKDPSMSNIGRNNALPRFAVSSLFHRLFPRHLLRFHAHADLGFGFHRCLDGSSGGSLAQRIYRVLALYWQVPCPPRVYRWDRCSENTQCRSRHAASIGFMLSSPVAHFVSRVPGP